jgi:hypothetical protein
LDEKTPSTVRNLWKYKKANDLYITDSDSRVDVRKMADSFYIPLVHQFKKWNVLGRKIKCKLCLWLCILSVVLFCYRSVF